MSQIKNVTQNFDISFIGEVFSLYKFAGLSSIICSRRQNMVAFICKLSGFLQLYM